MDIMAEKKKGKGWITLNRPHALNALSLPMIKDLHDLFYLWNKDPDMTEIIIQGEGKAFCAGGDLKSVYQAQYCDKNFLEAIFRIEYTANLRLKNLSKPYVALLQGYVMGGGMGASVHGSHRIATDSTCMAMPETKIGYFPDVGASYFLNQCPGFTGLYLGLTGKSIDASDALYVGWATHYVPLKHWDSLKKIVADDTIEKALYLSEPLEPSWLQNHRKDIDDHFSHPSLEEIFDSLKTSSTAFAQETLHLLNKRCPLSLKITFRQLKESKGKSFEAIMRKEYALSQVFVENQDFFEGIRAVIIDKDHVPHWQHKTIYDVKEEDIDLFFNFKNHNENFKTPLVFNETYLS